ncbi:MAG: endolytic transglycosylase MltG [Bacteroidetes bacterium]|nr:endolytic transglycosylase MltG [Bacteroidota bacterium]
MKMFKKIIISILLIGIGIGAYIGYTMYTRIYMPNVTLTKSKTAYFYIKTGSNFTDVANGLYEGGYIKNRTSFEWVSQKKSNFTENIKPGKYLLKEGMSNNELVDLLRSGKQEPVKLSFDHIRTIAELAGKLSSNIEADSSTTYSLLTDNDFVAQYGLNTKTILTLFIPNTYEFYWNTSSEELVKRMAEEYKKFWNDERKAKAKAMDLSQSEVSILASIVQAEQSVRADERSRVAGLYINRLRIGMRLQSDPTVIYGVGDFEIKRVTGKYLAFDSPYNTYKYLGLPPGPIVLPSIKSLDAVLNYEKHNYIYMCAKEDFSGYHNFAVNFNDHQVNARKFQQELNRRNIH